MSSLDFLPLVYFLAGGAVGALLGVITSIFVRKPVRKPAQGLTAVGVLAPARPGPAPDSVSDWKQKWPELAATCTELLGTMRGLYVDDFGKANILVKPQPGQGGVLSPANPWGVLLLQAGPGYEDKVIVPKPGTKVQVLQDRQTKKVYFIGIVN